MKTPAQEPISFCPETSLSGLAQAPRSSQHVQRELTGVSPLNTDRLRPPPLRQHLASAPRPLPRLPHAPTTLRAACPPTETPRPAKPEPRNLRPSQKAVLRRGELWDTMSAQAQPRARETASRAHRDHSAFLPFLALPPSAASLTPANAGNSAIAPAGTAVPRYRNGGGNRTPV